MTNPVTKRWMVVIGFLLVLQLAGGCRSACLPPADWPATWGGRQLYPANEVYIYASTPQAADQAQDRIEKVVADFIARSEVKPGRGLVIMMDVHDALPLGLTARQIFELIDATVLQKRHRSPTHSVDDRWAHQEAGAGKAGLTVEQIVVLQACPLPLKPLADDMKLPPSADVTWAVLMPSDSLIRQTNRQMVTGTMKAQKVNMSQRALVATMMRFLEGKMLEAVAEMNNVIVFEQMARHCGEWDEARAVAETDKYHTTVSSP